MGSQTYKRYSLGLVQQTGFTTSSIALLNGNKVLSTVTTTSNNGAMIFCRILRTTWLGSRTGAGWFPRGNNVDQSQFDYYEDTGAYYSYDDTTNTLSPIDDNVDQSQIVIKNKSGSTQTFIFDANVRYILNQAGGGTSS